MYQLKPEDARLLPEFLRRERKDFSLELRRVLNRLRLVAIAGREVIVAAAPNGPWRVARMGARRGAPVDYIDDRLFTEHKRAEYEVLKMRWRRLTGLPLAGE